MIAVQEVPWDGIQSALLMQTLSEYFIFFVGITAVLSACMLVYCLIAARFGIIDKPNHRSSHLAPVIRGAGIIFPIAFLLCEVWTGFPHPYALTGLLIIAVISFADDVKEQKPSIRLPLHALAVVLLLMEVQFFDENVFLIVIAFVIIIGSINAFNFMDGINGITGLYGLTNIATFFTISITLYPFAGPLTFLAVIGAILVFLFFNFRKKAQCFAGDVGSISLAFIQIFFLMMLIKYTHSFSWVLLFTVFGVDASITIAQRLVRRENIFLPHRSHLYQYLANELKTDHRVIAGIYATVQGGINIVVYRCNEVHDVLLIPALLIPVIIVYCLIRTQVNKSIKTSTTKPA
jgi:UDP-GlcNAc:undecaprenyl-phosphate/decaprenyl-phosphate GlcNAc-1-phosphate transferase